MFDQHQPYVLVFGASVVDIVGFCGVPYLPFNSNPGRVKISFGGVCRNIAENMARIGINTKFISIVGDDETGRSMMEHAQLIGFDMQDSLVLTDGRTPTYMAILNENGEMVSALSDMEGIHRMTSAFIDAKAPIFEGADYVIVDTDSPENLEYVLKHFHQKTRFILDPISSAKASAIRHLLGYFHTIKPNRHEAEALAGFAIKDDESLLKASAYFRSLGVQRVFISLDEDGVFFDDGTQAGCINGSDVTVVNVTGAGDALVAGLAYGYSNKMTTPETMKYALAMSKITICHENTINPHLDDAMLLQTYAETTYDVRLMASPKL